MLARIIREVFRGVAARAPRAEDPAALVEQGNAHAEAGDHAAAVDCFERAIARDPSSAVAHNNLSLSLFALGRLRDAWRESEWRFQMQDSTRAFAAAPPVPRWRGQPLAGGRLIVLWEQGLGDVIQHLRFLPAAAQRAGDAAFLCSAALAPLVRASFPEIEVLEARKGQAPEWRRFDAHVPLLSLPHVLGVAEDALPVAPYLKVPGAGPRAAEAGIVRVGIVWRTSGDDPRRDCPLPEMLAMAGGSVRLVCLQFQPKPDEKVLLDAAGIEQRAGDFVATAREALDLDAVVSVDTSTVHLCAALGRPTLVLLNEPYFVRWQASGRTSRWYPSVTLLRKRGAEPWRQPVGEAATLLRAMTAGQA